ncbi:hypothetical protein DIE08_18800 [Burkholderia sp. Bp9004]|nr:hypothetical protein DIE08_18800 [Burkholderia sp. Bp9004]
MPDGPPGRAIVRWPDYEPPGARVLAARKSCRQIRTIGQEIATIGQRSGAGGARRRVWCVWCATL